MKKVLVLGATGSIGKSTLQIIKNMGEHFCLAGITAYKSKELLESFAKEFNCPSLLMEGRTEADLKEFIASCAPNIVVNAIAGSSGLIPSKLVLEEGIDLALANKESIVMAWHLLHSLASDNKCNIIPIDSEHSALFSLINQVGSVNIEKVIITASGGPFRTTSKGELENVTVNDALKHPSWHMGRKITIDSATLANKGLEIIEASHLFNLTVDKIEVVVHPQSIIHSLVQTKDGFLYAQLSNPDMKRPILSALNYPEIKKTYLEPFSLFDRTLTFFKPRLLDFPMLSYAFEVAKKGKSYAIAYNASNEVAVDAFLNQRIDFTTISRVVRSVLDKDWNSDIKSFPDVFIQDAKAREFTKKAL